jgi:hypothetical protein
MDDRHDKVTRIRQLLQEAAPPAQERGASINPVATVSPKAQGLTSDDTLGKILRAIEPSFRRYMLAFAWTGLITLPIRVFTLYRAAGSWLMFGAWANEHEPFWMFKWLGAVATIAFTVWIFREWFRTERARWLRKRDLKKA